MNRNVNLVAIIGLAIGAIFGLSGSFVTDPIVTIVLYEISSVGLIVSLTILALKFLKEDRLLLATGFLLFSIGEAIMSGGTAAGELGGQAAFGGGMALYGPALLLISIPKKFPIWGRMTGLAACIPFGLVASKIFLGEVVLSSSALPGAGYGLLTLTIISWIWTLAKETTAINNPTYQQAASVAG